MGNPVLKAIMLPILHSIAKRYMRGPEKHKLTFGIVDNREKWEKIRALRLSEYTEILPYMMDVLNKDGTDLYDSRSVVFGLWDAEKAIATIRFTAAPYEFSCFLSSEDHNNSLNNLCAETTVEFSRLIVARKTPYKGVVQALIIFAGLNILCFTDYRHYIGYTKLGVFKKLRKFAITDLGISFSIPSRGDHSYCMLSGDFRNDLTLMFKKMMPKPLPFFATKKASEAE